MPDLKLKNGDLARLDVAQFKEAIDTSDGVTVYPHAAIVKAAPALVTKADGDNPDDLIQTWTISTPAVDRDGDTVDPKGWKLKNYRAGGSVLWAHRSGEPPIAKPLKTWIDGDALKSRAQFTPRDLNPFGFMIHELAAGGYVRGASVGFRPIAFEHNQERDGFMPLDFTKQELLEWSVTPVPSNPEALRDAQAKGISIDPIKAWIERIQDNEPGAMLPPGVTRDDLQIAYRCVSSAVTTVDFNSHNPGAADLKGAPDTKPKTKKGITVMALLKDQAAAVVKFVDTANETIAKEVDQVIESLGDVATFEAEHGDVLSDDNRERLAKAKDLIDRALAAPETPADAESDADQKDADDILSGITEDQIKAAIAEAVATETKTAIDRINGRVD